MPDPKPPAWADGAKMNPFRRLHFATTRLLDRHERAYDHQPIGVLMRERYRAELFVELANAQSHRRPFYATQSNAHGGRIVLLLTNNPELADR